MLLWCTVLTSSKPGGSKPVHLEISGIFSKRSAVRVSEKASTTRAACLPGFPAGWFPHSPPPWAPSGPSARKEPISANRRTSTSAVFSIRKTGTYERGDHALVRDSAQHGNDSIARIKLRSAIVYAATALRDRSLDTERADQAQR